MSATIVKLPEVDILDVPRMLRELANNVESGKYGDHHTLAWIIDCGDGRFEMGLMGAAAEYGPTAHLLFGIAQHRIAAGCVKP